jgi:predicted XRE-type DNA-binding protein
MCSTISDLSRSEASALKVTATLLDAILGEIETRGCTQRELVEILDEYQPSVSNLVRGKIAKVSLEKLLAYSDRLKMRTTLTVYASSCEHRGARSHLGLRAGSNPRARSARELFASTLLQLAKIGYRVGEEKGLRWHVGPV